MNKDHAFYNPNVKEDFLIYFAEDRKTVSKLKYELNMIVQIFNRMAPAEEKAGKDMGIMDIGELTRALEQVGAPTYTLLGSYLRYIRIYLVWYYKTQDPHPSVIAQPNWRQIDLAPYFRNIFISGPERIASDWFDFKPEDGHYVQPIYVLMWYGVQLQDAIELKGKDVVDNGDSFFINYKDGVTITDPSSVAILRAYRAFTSRADGKWQNPHVENYLYRLVRPTDPDEKGILTRTIAYNRLQILKNTRGERYINMYDGINLRNAGLFSRIIQIEKQNGELSDKNLTDMVGIKMTQPWYVDAVRLAIQKYKEAFDL